MRTKMNKEDTSKEDLFRSYEIGKPIYGGAVVKVLKSNHGAYQSGDIMSCHIAGSFDWQKIQKKKIPHDQMKNYFKIDASIKVPLSYYLGKLKVH